MVSSTDQRRILTIGVTGVGTDSSAILRLAMSHPDIIFINTPTSLRYDITESARRFGKSWHRLYQVIKIAKRGIEKIAPRMRHDWLMLFQYFKGGIVNPLHFKGRPAIARKNPTSKDRLVNKRKSFLKSLYA